MTTILLTGASSGVGKVLAEQLIADGYTVAGVARSEDKLSAMQAELGDAFKPIPWDLTETASLGDLAEVAKVSCDGCPDVVIHNAAMFIMENYDKQDPAAIEKLIQLNTLAPMILTRALLPDMLERKAGRIINIASVAGIGGLPKQASYCASKHALLGFADALSNELRGTGVNIANICPGGINTPLWQGDTAYPGNVDQTMAPKEIADLVCFMLKQPTNTIYRRVIMFPECEWH